MSIAAYQGVCPTCLHDHSAPITALASGSGDHAELAAISSAIGTVRFMDPPDGGDVPLSEQVRRMVSALTEAERKLAEAERGAEFIARLLPSAAGLDDAPDNKVVAVYINMRELRQARTFLSKEAERG